MPSWSGLLTVDIPLIGVREKACSKDPHLNFQPLNSALTAHGLWSQEVLEYTDWEILIKRGSSMGL